MSFYKNKKVCWDFGCDFITSTWMRIDGFIILSLLITNTWISGFFLLTVG